MSRVTAILTANLILFVWGCGFDVGASRVHENFEKTVQLDFDGARLRRWCQSRPRELREDGSARFRRRILAAIQVETWDRDEIVERKAPNVLSDKGQHFLIEG